MTSRELAIAVRPILHARRLMACRTQDDWDYAEAIFFSSLRHSKLPPRGRT